MTIQMHKKLKCRICKKTIKKNNFKLCLTNAPLIDDFILEDSSEQEYLNDINTCKFGKCGVVQNPSNRNLSEYISTYGHFSSAALLTKTFMSKMCDNLMLFFKEVNGRDATSVFEPGPGDGVKLAYFANKGCFVIGIEPNQGLVEASMNSGINTRQGLFNRSTINSTDYLSFDIGVTSYTFDNCTDPLGFLRVANLMLKPNRLIAIEAHDLSEIERRSEYCLFEHEHIEYLGAHSIEELLRFSGLRICRINPIDKKCIRANSLVKRACKTATPFEGIYKPAQRNPKNNSQCNNFNLIINSLVARVYKWVEQKSEILVGCGAEDRGVMTLTQLSNTQNLKKFLANEMEAQMGKCS